MVNAPRGEWLSSFHPESCLMPWTQPWLECDLSTWRKALARARVPAAEAPGSGAVLAASQAVFTELANTWRRETAAMSSVASMAMHPAYQRIIGMGAAALPLIFRQLSRQPGHWFWALAAITGENPVPPEEAGDVRRMTERWLEFARKRGYL